MKATTAAAAASAAAGAYAQSVSYTTMTIDDCSSMPMETMITVTEGTTVTYCPTCNMESTKGPGYTTVYTTTYISLCPTGTVPATYTVTESCTDDTPTWTPGPSHIPQGFTVTGKVCHVCDKTPTTLTITEPCGCEAHEGTPVPNPNPMPTPPPSCDGDDCGGDNNQTPPSCDGDDCGEMPPVCDGDDCGGDNNQTPPSCDGDDCGGDSNQTPPACDGDDCGGMPPACDGDDCGGDNNQTPPSGGSPPAKPPTGPPSYSTPKTTGTEQCPGPQCRTHQTGMPPPPGVVPNTGGASSLTSFAFVSSAIMAVGVAALAFAL